MNVSYMWQEVFITMLKKRKRCKDNLKSSRAQGASGEAPSTICTGWEATDSAPTSVGLKVSTPRTSRGGQHSTRYLGWSESSLFTQAWNRPHRPDGGQVVQARLTKLVTLSSFSTTSFRYHTLPIVLVHNWRRSNIRWTSLRLDCLHSFTNRLDNRGFNWCYSRWVKISNMFVLHKNKLLLKFYHCWYATYSFIF